MNKESPRTYANATPKHPNTRRLEFGNNMAGATWAIINMDNWTIHDIGFGSRSWLGCKVKLIKRGLRIAIEHDGTWQEISADIKRG